MAWKKGPLPENTRDWGAVVLKGEIGSGFHFAYFHGDHVTLCPDDQRFEGADVEYYDNSIKLPPECPEGKTYLKA